MNKGNKIYNVFGARKSKNYENTKVVNITLVCDAEDGGREFALICRKQSDDTQLVMIKGKPYVKLLIPFLKDEKKEEAKAPTDEEIPF